MAFEQDFNFTKKDNCALLGERVRCWRAGCFFKRGVHDELGSEVRNKRKLLEGASHEKT